MATTERRRQEQLTQSLDRVLAAHSLVEKYCEDAELQHFSILILMAVHEYCQEILGPQQTSEIIQRLEAINRSH